VQAWDLAGRVERASNLAPIEHLPIRLMRSLIAAGKLSKKASYTAL